MKATNEGSKIAKDYTEANLARIEGRNSQVMFGILLADMGLYDQSIKYFERLVADRNLPSRVPDDVVARTYNEIGTALDIKGEYPKALEFYERAYNLTVNEDHQDDKDIVNSATPIANMAYVYRNLGQYKTSFKLYSQALEIVEAYFDAEHLERARILECIASVYYDLEDGNRSLEYFQKAYEIYKQLLPENHLNIARILDNIGVTYIDLNELDLATDFLQQSLKMRRKLLPTEHIDIAHSLTNNGGILFKKYCFTKALDHYNQGLKIHEHLFPNGHKDTAHTLESFTKKITITIQHQNITKKLSKFDNIYYRRIISIHR